MIRRSRPAAWLPLAGLALTILIWSSNNIVGKMILREASPMMIALLRFTLAGLLFYLPVFLLLHRGEQRFSRADWQRLFLLGTAGTLGSLVFYLVGLRTTPAVEAGIYQVTTPLFVLVIARLWLGERLGRARIAGLTLATFGAAFLASGGGAVGLAGGDPLGVLFILTSNLTWAGYTILTKELLARRSPLLVVAAANLIATLMAWPAAALLGTLSELPSVLAWSPTAWLVMLYLVAFMSTSSQWLYLRCLREVPASQASAMLNLMPLFTAVMAAVFLGELPTLVTLAGGLAILAGVWLVNRPRGVRALSAERTTGSGVKRSPPARR
jgi:drug/metabolite transporter (DMT)-like permease